MSEVDEKKAKLQKRNTIGCLVFIGIFSVMVSSCTIMLGNMGDEDTLNEYESSVVISGDVAILTQDTFVYKTKEAGDELYAYIRADNKDAITRMAGRGEIFLLKKGIEVTVIDRGLASSQIEVNSTGERWYLGTEYLEKK